MPLDLYSVLICLISLSMLSDDMHFDRFYLVKHVVCILKTLEVWIIVHTMHTVIGKSTI